MAQLEHEEQLQKIFTNVNEWLKFAEAKNFGLMTLNAGIIFGISQITFSNESILIQLCYYMVIPFASISFLVSLISVFPILTKIDRKKNNNGVMVDNSTRNFINKFSNWIDKEGDIKNIHFYGYLCTLKVGDFENKFLNKINSTIAFSEYEKDLSEQILYNSRITNLKYQLFKIAAFFFLFGIVMPIIVLGLITLIKLFNS
jgi:hypothetical protein